MSALATVTFLNSTDDSHYDPAATTAIPPIHKAYYNSSAGSDYLPATERLKKTAIAYYYTIPDVPVLPERVWTPTVGRAPTLREAYTQYEVETAIRRIDHIKDYRDVVTCIGDKYGILFSCFDRSFWGAKYKDQMEVIDEANDKVETLGRIEKEIRKYGKPPVGVEELVKTEQSRAEFMAKMHIDCFEHDIENVKQAIRDAYIQLRLDDIYRKLYGTVTLRGLTKEEKEERKELRCSMCERYGHKACDHKRWKCASCKEAAPHHWPQDCNKKNIDRKKKKKAKEMGTYKDSKFDLPDEDADDDGWTSQATLGWDGKDDGWSSVDAVEAAKWA